MLEQDDRMEIPFSGQTTFEDFERAQKLQMGAAGNEGKSSMRKTVPTALVWFIVICVAIPVLLTMNGMRISSWSLAPIIGVVVGFVVLYLAFRATGKRSIRASWKEREHSLDKLRGSIHSDAIMFRTEHCTSRMEWPAFTGYDDDGTVLILSDGKLIFHVVTKAMFRSQADWEQALSVIAANLPRHGSADDPNTVAANCSVCGCGFRKEVMIELNGKWSCAKCKDIAVQKLREGVS